MTTPANHPEPNPPRDPQPLGVLASFASPDELVRAIRDARQRGFRKLEAFTPFPSHDVDHALAVKSSRLAWFVLAAGITGGILALAGQWWTNAVDYPFKISGKPLFSLPSNIPVTFEVIILASATTAFLGMFVLNGLPRLSNPLFRTEAFRKASQDRFLLWFDAGEPAALAEDNQQHLRSLGAADIEVCYEDTADSRLPTAILAGIGCFALLALVPPLLVANSRGSVSSTPRLSIWDDMDYQPKLKPQSASSVFADRRASRPRVAGTVPRGQLRTDRALYEGIDPARLDPRSVATPVGLQQRMPISVDSEPAGEAHAETPDETPLASTNADSDSESPATEPPWLEELPIPVTEALMQRGRERFGIYCALCHGHAGDGDGLVSQRALSLEQGTWVPPTSLHVDYVRAQPVGKLYDTITNGIRKMPGYRGHVDVEDRWAIALYVRALQRSRLASVEDVPTEIRSELRSNE